MTRAEFQQALTDGPYAFPGGYPRFFLMGDGEAVSFKAAEERTDEIRAAIDAGNARADWFPVAVEINWEDPDLYCAHSGARIESAYAEEDESDVDSDLQDEADARAAHGFEGDA